MKSRIALLAVLATAACRSSHDPKTSVASPPGAESAAAGRPDLEIEIALDTSPALAVRYRTCCAAAEDGRTTFRIDDRWGGIEDAASLVLDPRFTGEGGRELAADHPNANEWLVRSRAGERVEAAWRLAPNDYRANSDPRVHYHPILDPELYHAIGHLAFLVPKIDDETPRRVAVHWKGFAEAGWRVGSSLGSDPKGFEGTATLEEVLHSVYLAGPDLRVLVEDVRGRPVTIAIGGTGWSFADRDFAKAVGSIVETERAFFADDDFPTYLVSLIPVGRPDPRSRSFGGTGLTRSFACFLQPDTKLGLNDGEPFGVPQLLAHEMFHHWNGGLTSMEEPEQLVYWFSEGFTNFFARRILLRAGIGGPEEAVRSLNQALEDYYLSPVRDEPGERIRQDFWKDRDVGKLPYLRGDLVAVLLDREIRNRSGGTRSLDEFLREVVDAGRHGEKLGNESLLRRVEAWTSAEFAASVRSIVVEGATITLDPSTFEPCLEVTSEKLGRFDLGFDFEASRAAKEVRGVRSGSAAERAGLADGQRVTRFSIALGNPTQPVEIGIREGETDRKITWLPQGDPIDVPRVRVREGSVPADCTRL